MNNVIRHQLRSWRYQEYDEYWRRSERIFHSIEFIELKDSSEFSNELEEHDS